MRFPIPLLILAAVVSSACAVGLTVADVVTTPMDTRGQFSEIHQQYSADIRFGLFEDALAYVEPDQRPRFQQEMERLRQIRFSDHRVEKVELDSAQSRATVVVRYRGYWLSSPFEQEVRVVQHWRRERPGQNWFVTPDFDALLDPPGPSGSPASPQRG